MSLPFPDECMHMCAGLLSLSHFVFTGRMRGGGGCSETTQATGSHWKQFSIQHAQSAAARVRKQHKPFNCYLLRQQGKRSFFMLCTIEEILGFPVSMSNIRPNT